MQRYFWLKMFICEEDSHASQPFTNNIKPANIS